MKGCFTCCPMGSLNSNILLHLISRNNELWSLHHIAYHFFYKGLTSGLIGHKLEAFSMEFANAAWKPLLNRLSFMCCVYFWPHYTFIRAPYACFRWRIRSNAIYLLCFIGIITPSPICNNKWNLCVWYLSTMPSPATDGGAPYWAYFCCYFWMWWSHVTCFL